jgi:hypothetical protein
MTEAIDPRLLQFAQTTLRSSFQKHLNDLDAFLDEATAPILTSIIAQTLLLPVTTEMIAEGSLELFDAVEERLTRSNSLFGELFVFRELPEDFQLGLVTQINQQFFSHIMRMNLPVWRFIMTLLFTTEQKTRTSNAVQIATSIALTKRSYQSKTEFINESVTVSNDIHSLNDPNINGVPTMIALTTDYSGVTSIMPFVKDHRNFIHRSRVFYIPQLVELLSAHANESRVNPLHFKGASSPDEIFALTTTQIRSHQVMVVPDFDAAANICFPNVPNRASRNSQFEKMLASLGFERGFKYTKTNWFVRRKSNPLLENPLLFFSEDDLLLKKRHEIWIDMTVGNDSMNGELLEGLDDPYNERFKQAPMKKLVSGAVSLK